MHLQDYDWSTVLVAVAIFLISIIFLLRPTNSKSSNDKLPPLVEGSFFSIAPIFFSSRAPFFLLECARRIGKVYRLPLVPNGNFVVVTDHKVARQVLEDTKSEKPALIYQGFNAIFGGGESFFTASGHRWKHVRKSTNQAFAPKQKERMIDIVQQVLNKWINNTLEPKRNENTPLDFAIEMQLVTIGVIGRIGFDHELTQEEVGIIKDNLKVIYVEYMQRAPQNPLKQIPFTKWLFSGIREANRKSQEIRNILHNILEKHRLKTNPDQNTIIHMVCNNNEYNSDDERIRDLFAYLVGGFDTTAYSLAWTLLELAKNEKEQEYLRSELLKCTTSKDELYNCKALKNVIREGQRLHNTAALGSARQTGKDFSYGDCIIPKGSIIDCPFFAIHRDNDVFEQADEFMPQRWQNPSEDMLRSMLGFSAGKRNCQGQLVANVELVVILAELCSKYKFTVVEEGHVEYYVTLKPVGSLLKVSRY